MKNEAEFKVAWKKSIIQAKGMSISLSAPVFPGIPDLYCAVPGYIPVLLEAKWLGKIENTKFSRKINYTAMQRKWLTELHAVTPYSALGIVGLKYNNATYAVVVPVGSQFFDILDNSFLLSDAAFSPLQKGRFDVLSIFEKIPIPRIDYGLRQPADGLGAAPGSCCHHYNAHASPEAQTARVNQGGRVATDDIDGHSPQPEQT